MTDLTINDLSAEERELMVDFVEWVGEIDRQVLERQTIQGDSEAIGLQEIMEFLAPIATEDTSEFDAQMFRLFRLEQEIQSGAVFEYEKEDEIPHDAAITPDELNRFLKKDELEAFFTLAAQMIETLSVELVMEQVVAESRRSNSVRKVVTRKPQRERDWLLHVTGLISDGEKGEIRRIYDLRSTIVHSSEDSSNFLSQVDVPSDVHRGKRAVNTLHEALHGIELKHRFGDLIS